MNGAFIFTYVELNLSFYFLVQNDYSCKKDSQATDSSCKQNIISLSNRGAIPKTKITQTEKGHSSKTGIRKNPVLKDNVTHGFLENRKSRDLMEMKKSKVERENTIIGEEYGDFTQVVVNKKLP